MGHHVAALGDDATAAGTALPIAHHGVVALGGIVYPGIEVAQHTGVDGTEEVEKVFREVEVARVAFCLVPVDEILGHPYLLAFLGEVLICRLDTAVLVTAVDVEAVKNVGLVQCIGVVVADGECLGSHNLAADGTAVGLHELSYLRCRPQAAGILGRPVGFVLDGDGIQLHTVLPQVLHVVLQILGIVGPVLTLQLTRRAVAVLGIDGAVGLPLCGLSPW